MAVTVEIGGLKESLPGEFAQYEDAFRAGEEAMKQAIAIFGEEGFDEKKGWTYDAKSENVIVHHKDMKDGRVFAGRTNVLRSSEAVNNEFWNELERAPEWNENVKFAKYVAKLTPHADIAHYASNDVLIIKSREFLCGRSYRKIGDAYIVAARSFTHKDFPEQKSMVRGHLYLGAGRCRPDPENEKHCIYDYVVCMDLKGMLFKSAINQVLGRIITSDIESVKKRNDAFGANE